MSTPTIDASRGLARLDALGWVADRVSLLTETTAIGQQIDRLERANGPNAEYDDIRRRAPDTARLRELLRLLPEPCANSTTARASCGNVKSPSSRTPPASIAIACSCI